MLDSSTTLLRQEFVWDSGDGDDEGGLCTMNVPSIK
jgi:hypothetical protein